MPPSSGIKWEPPKPEVMPLPETSPQTLVDGHKSLVSFTLLPAISVVLFIPKNIHWDQTDLSSSEINIFSCSLALSYPVSLSPESILLTNQKHMNFCIMFCF
jgi:hypothetical protein